MNNINDIQRRESNALAIYKLDMGNCPICEEISTVKNEENSYECYHCHTVMTLDYSSKQTGWMKYKGSLVHSHNGIYKYI